MSWKREWKALVLISATFLLCFFLPVESFQQRASLGGPVVESLHLARDYARKHVLTCLMPAFLIAGAIAVFLGKASVMKYLGAGANKVLAYAVASVSGSVLAVCSCTVLPLFAGIYRMGAGLGPATAFLYAGPAINVLAVVLTARVLGPELGIARALGAVVFSVVIGLAMHVLFRRQESEREKTAPIVPEDGTDRPLWQNTLLFASLVGILVFANWGRPTAPGGPWDAIYNARWVLTGLFALALAVMLVAWLGLTLWKVVAVAAATVLTALLSPAQPLLAFSAALVGISIAISTEGGEAAEWFWSSWGFAKQILPLLLLGVLVAGLLLGRPGSAGLIPARWVAAAVGGNGLLSTLFAAISGAFMYFATLTEVPIVEGLLGAGMGKGPALALLLAGPALSLPNMLVIRSVMGTRKTAAFVALVVVMATSCGLVCTTILG